MALLVGVLMVSCVILLCRMVDGNHIQAVRKVAAMFPHDRVSLQPVVYARMVKGTTYTITIVHEVKSNSS